jgi:hypothetical protein
MYQRFHAVRSEDEAVEAIGALREVLELEDLVRSNLMVEPRVQIRS